MKKEELFRLIRSVAGDEGLDGDLVVAICMQESNAFWPKCASRFEPHIKNFDRPEYFAQINGITVETEKREQATSWGPMHVLGSTARSLKYDGPLPLLFMPELSVIYACKLLAQISERYEAEESVIAAYNAGSAKRINGRFVNQGYVDAVMDRLRKIRRMEPQLLN